ncbi:hypothetical protein AJ80_03610 [Polytolypa hystricis UAMH7299]|uniref:Glucose-methanol-choline oxidoreductase N-terminal domain-containing protein n=1 Tax=Polytolypa hystricis (strain UAMH7299) TaxID=1447883 RepID=A0A2B7YHJ5_POLH7|nr:hypothetical protein AJ80_03610 [Polytolypa hystricis UAMH7299]
MASASEDVTPQRFDYIVVGAGIGGLVVATRLSEDADNTVLLIEAGSNRMGDPRVDTPALMVVQYGDPEFDWGFVTEPQKHVNDRQISHPRGKVVGGSSAMNFGCILYPSDSNFNAWAALGNDGWAAEDMAPYFRKFQTFVPSSNETRDLLSLDNYMDETNQGTDGPLPVTLPNVYGEFNKAWNSAFENLGWQTGDDPIKGKKLGAFTCPQSMDPKTGTRGYAATYYTSEVAKRPNLHLLADTQVAKVFFDSNKVDGDVVATGVQVILKDGSVKQTTAQKEVILSAGALQSPQLLELSGVGGSDILNKYNIPVVVDSPGVGENLQDHCISHLSFEVADDQISGDIVRSPEAMQALMKLYEETRSGPLAGMPVSAAYMPLVDANGRVSKDEIEKLLQEHLDNDTTKSLSPALQKQYKLLRQMLLDPNHSSGEYMFLPIQMHTKPGKTSMGEIIGKELPGNYVSILALNNHPFSRGSVHIQSADIQTKPIFDPNYLSHPLDLEILARHTQYMDKIVQTEPFASLLKTPSSRIPANADVSNLQSAKNVVKERLFTCFHPAATCAMMPRELGGVVNNRLMVHGTRNLRVVDASVFPLEPLGNIQATVYAVAEKAADIIKEDAKRT